MASRQTVWRCGILVGVLAGVACGDDDDPSGTGPDTEGTASTTLATTLTTAPMTTESDPDSSTSADGSATASDESDSSTGGPACPASHACVGVPIGWTGPVVLRESADPGVAVECPAAYPDAAEAGRTGLVAPAALCGCECGDATGVACRLSTTLRNWGSDPTCSVGAPASSHTVFATVCNALGAPISDDSYFQIEPVGVEGGSCMPEASVQLAPPAFTRAASVCGGAELLEGCGDAEVCAPQGSGDALCVWQDGDAPCPDGFDGDRRLYHRSVDDTRGCNECTCGAPVGLCDAATATLFNNICNPPVSGFVGANGECYAGSTFYSTSSAILSLGEPNAFCVANSPVAVGTATPIEPVTVCCG